jgi:hypothetical protein
MFSSSRPSLKFAALALGGALCITVGLTACGKNKGKVYFGNLTDGAEVESPFTVEMMAENLVVEPAANGVQDGHGHFHILVDTDVPRSMDPVPNDPQHIHYGQGQSEAVLDLPVGEHTLTLQFAKGDHRPFDPQITQTIKVLVTKQNIVPTAEGSADMTGSDQYKVSNGPNGTSAEADSAGKVEKEGSGIGGGVGVGSGGMGGGAP